MAISTVFSENPLDIIDISQADQSTADKLLQAAKTQGFMMVEGHGLSQTEANKLFQISKSFFDLPFEEKSKHTIDEGNYGYTGIGMENLEEDDPNKSVGDQKEAFNFAYVNLTTGKVEHPLPDVFKTVENDQFITKMIFKFRDTAHQIVRLLAMGLRIDPADGGSEWFVNRNDISKPSGSALRFLHYPAPSLSSDQTEEQLIEQYRDKNVAGAHTDYGQVSLLLQRANESGLQLYSPISHRWESVPFVETSTKYKTLNEAPPLIINIADQLSYWTDGFLKSTVHRVRLTEETVLKGRYSVVFFSHPSFETELVPVPSTLVREFGTSKKVERGASYQVESTGKPITASEHLQKRLNVAYSRDS